MSRILPWSLPLLLGLATAGLFAGWARRANFDGLLADGYIYLLMADALSHAPASDALNWRFLFGEYSFPPLYPLLLAMVNAGADNPLNALMLNAGLLGASFAVLARWYMSLGIAAGPALLLSLCCALLPISFITALDVQSEPLYLVLTLSALYVLQRAPDTANAWWVAGICCGLAVLTRTAGLALLGAFTLSWLRAARRPKSLALWCAWLPLLGWQIFRDWHGLAASYLRYRSLAPQDLWDATRQIVPINLRAIAYAVPRSFDLQGAPHVGIVLALLGVCAGVVLVQRVRRAECAALYVLLYLGLILCWPHPDHLRRFLFVVLPLMAGYAACAIAAGFSARSSRWSANTALYALPAVLLLLTAPSLLSLRHELALAVTPELRAVTQSPARYLAPSLDAAVMRAQAFNPVIRLLQHAQTELPAVACIASAIPEQVMFYARRPGLDLIHALAAPSTLLRQCPYVLMIAFRSFPDSGVPPMFPFAELRGDLEILDLVRVDPSNQDSPARAILALYRPPEN